jgi:hypothetical protein
MSVTTDMANLGPNPTTVTFLVSRLLLRFVFIMLSLLSWLERLTSILNFGDLCQEPGLYCPQTGNAIP